MNHWTDKLNTMERNAYQLRISLKDRFRVALNSGNYVEADQIHMQLLDWERQFAKDNGSLPEYRED